MNLGDFFLGDTGKLGIQRGSEDQARDEHGRFASSGEVASALTKGGFEKGGLLPTGRMTYVKAKQTDRIRSKLAPEKLNKEGFKVRKHPSGDGTLIVEHHTSGDLSNRITRERVEASAKQGLDAYKAHLDSTGFKTTREDWKPGYDTGGAVIVHEGPPKSGK